MRKKIFLAIFIFFIISSIAVNTHAYVAFGAIQKKGKVDRIEYMDVKTKETNSLTVNAAESKGTVYVEDNDTTYNNTYIKAIIKDPFMFLKNSKTKAEEKNYVQLTIRDNVPVVEFGGLIYPDGNWLVSGGDPVYIGDANAKNNDTRKRIGAYINFVKAIQNKYSAGHTMSFNDFTAIYAADNWYKGSTSGVGKEYPTEKVTLKIIPIIKDINTDETVTMYACGKNQDVELIKFEYKLKTWFDNNYKTPKNLYEFSTAGTGWQDNLRNHIKSLGFNVDSETMTAFGKNPITGFSVNRIKQKKDDIIFEVTADGTKTECAQYGLLEGGSKPAKKTIEKGKKYTIKLTEIFYLVKEEKMYFNLLIDAEEDVADDSEVQGSIDYMNQQIIISFKKLADKMPGSQRTEKPGFVAVVDNIGNYIPTGDIDPADETQLLGKVNVVLSTIVDIGIVIAVIMIAVLGVKYMLGSVEEKAEYKKTMVPYVVGVIMLMGITTIVKILQTLGENINNI